MLHVLETSPAHTRSGGVSRKIYRKGVESVGIVLQLKGGTGGIIDLPSIAGASVVRPRRFSKAGKKMEESIL